MIKLAKILFLICCVQAAALTTVIGAPGDLDPGFGNGGKVVLPNHNGEFKGVRLLSSGKVLVWGGSTYIIARRYNADGSPDLNYGYGGTASWYNIPANPFVPGEPNDAEVMPDGSLIVVGKYTPDPAVNEFKAAVWRFTPEGLLDPSFGSGGRLLLSGSNGKALKLAIHNSKLYIYYFYFQENNQSAYRLTRRLSNGAIDFTFGSVGNVSISGVSDLKVSPSDGKIYVTQTYGSLKRFNADGSVDTSFGMFGTAPKPQYQDVCPGMTGMGYSSVSVNFAPGGKLLVAGILEDVVDPYWVNRASVLTRYTGSGFVDDFFNGGELVCTAPLISTPLHPQAVAQTDGKVLFASALSSPYLQRRSAFGNSDASYVYENAGALNEIRDLVVQGDGKAVLLYGYGNELHRRLP